MAKIDDLREYRRKKIEEARNSASFFVNERVAELERENALIQSVIEEESNKKAREMLEKFCDDYVKKNRIHPLGYVDDFIIENGLQEGGEK
jgi:vacuolar-type H+-ATPase subunit H